MSMLTRSRWLSKALLRLLLPLLALVLTVLSSAAFAGPKPASGQFLPTGPYAGAVAPQNATLHQGVWQTTVPPPSGVTNPPNTGTGGTGSNVPPLFRGTSDGYPGSTATQAAGVTPTTTNPAVATVFGTAAQQYGNGVVQIAVPGDVAEVDIVPGNVLAGSEAEVGVNMPPTQFAGQASITISAGQARTILQNMGIPVPGSVTAQGADLTQLLQGLPPMSQAQINTFVQQASQLAKGP